MLEVSINVGEEKYKQYFGRRGVNISFIFHAFQTYFKARDTYLRFFSLTKKRSADVSQSLSTWNILLPACDVRSDNRNSKCIYIYTLYSMIVCMTEVYKIRTNDKIMNLT